MALLDEITLHNIKSENVVFCYREGDSGSIEVANHYRAARGLPSANLIALPCSSDNIISEADFINTIHDPLLLAIQTLGRLTISGAGSDVAVAASDATTGSIWVIILGFHIPHGYLQNDEAYGNPKAVASRLHRLGKTEVDQFSNFTFDRRGNFQFFGPNDASELFITAVIDGPTKEAAIVLIDRSIDVDNQTFVAGSVNVDPFGLKGTSDQLQYQADVVDFIDNEAPNLGLTIKQTVDTGSASTEPTFNKFDGESFYWGWFEPRYSKDLFLSTNQRRVFLYNADEDSASDVSVSFDSEGSDPWCVLAINIEPGYAACAGAISDPTESSFLRPRPFFEALHRGASLGEAFLFSSPVVDWKIFLIGDPLMTVMFPDDVPIEQDPTDISFPNNEVIRRVKESLEESVAWGARQTRLLTSLVDTNVSSSNLDEELNLLYALSKWNNMKSQDFRDSLLTTATSTFMFYILATTGITFPAWLNLHTEKTSELFNNLLKKTGGGAVPDEDTDDLVHPEGHWQFDFTYDHPFQTFENIHFQLQLSLVEDFSTIILEKRSFDDVTGWKYESEPFIFVQLVTSGFPSNFSGRIVRFVSPTTDFLTRTELYYVRWRALNSLGAAITNYQSAGQIIIKR